MQIGEAKSLKDWMPELVSQLSFKSMLVCTVNQNPNQVNQAVIELRQALEQALGKVQVLNEQFLDVGSIYQDNLLYKIEQVDFDYIMTATANPGAPLIKKYDKVVEGRTSNNLRTTTMINGSLSQAPNFPRRTLPDSVPRDYWNFHQVILREDWRLAGSFVLMKAPGVS